MCCVREAGVGVISAPALLVKEAFCNLSLRKQWDQELALAHVVEQVRRRSAR